MSRPLLLNFFLTCEYHDPSVRPVVTIGFFPSNASFVILRGDMVQIHVDGVHCLKCSLVLWMLCYV